MTDELNRAQRAAVDHEGRTLLVVAGPGTGKTHTLTCKLARMLSLGANPSRVAAVTFTTKAAAGMKSRLLEGWGVPRGRLPFIGTFHALGLRILQTAATESKRKIRIFSEAERRGLLREVMVDLGMTVSVKGLEETARRISYAKNQGHVLPEMAPPEGMTAQAFQSVREAYAGALKACDGLDFDDLVLEAVPCLERNTEQVPLTHLFLDEYQDINAPQYRLVRAMVNEATKICAIGDPDQAIYAFRGSDVGYFLRFGDEFQADTLSLTTNYRSSQAIVEAASNVISHNLERVEKPLRAHCAGGANLSLIAAANPYSEAALIAAEVEKLVGGTDRLYIDRSRDTDIYEDPASYDFSDFAVLYRTRSQAPILQRALERRGIPAQVVGGTPWFGEAEVQLPLSYLSVLIDPGDDLRCREIINQPRRRLSEKALDLVVQRAEILGIPFLETLWQMTSSGLPRDARDRLYSFVKNLRSLVVRVEKLDPVEALREVIARFDLESHFRDGSAKGERRYRNMQQMQACAAPFEKKGVAGIREMMAYFAMLGEHDPLLASSRGVALMTLHAAKGLEFPVVFLAGVEEGLIPHGEGNLEEERRLFYVGMTRAEQRLYLARAKKRGGGERASSRFLNEIPASLKTVLVSPTKRSKKGSTQLSLF